MYQILCNCLGAIAAILWVETAIANSLEVANNSNSNTMAQVTSVSQLSDVQPTDWAFLALQSLVERYGCIVGYPDSTFRGDRALTRYEFAAGLNACLDRINELISTGTANLVIQADLATLQRLQAEFTAELASLRGRVDNLEAQTAELEANQFSTTTKLTAELIVAASQAFGDRFAVSSPNVPTTDIESNTILTNRLWLYFDSSFSGKDRLRVRLQARNTPNFSTVTGTNMTRLGFEGNNNNNLDLSRLEYLLPFAGDRGRVFFEAVGGEFNDNMETFNPLLQGSGRGSISRFGRFNPIYRLSGNTGITLTYNLVERENTKVAFNIGYLAANANLASDPNGFNNAGLLEGPFGALAQLDIQPSKNFKFGLTYVRSENVDLSGGTGSAFASNPFLGTFGRDTDVISDSFGLQATIQVTPKFTLSGWVGYTLADAVSGASNGANAEILNWATTFAFPDLWHKGDVAGIVFGMPPKVVNTDVASRDDRDTSYHLEGFYRFRVSDYIFITPGAIVVFNPEHNSNNDTAILGLIRTTFVF